MANLPNLQQTEGKLRNMTYTIAHTVQDGIERIVYRPEVKRFETPILMQHGMYHGAWCWQFWQELFAEWGWESMWNAVTARRRRRFEIGSSSKELGKVHKPSRAPLDWSRSMVPTTLNLF
jgi:hypothetical protein